MPRQVEEDHVFGVVLDHVRNVGRAHKGETELVLRVAGLRLRLGSYGERGGIQRAVSPRPIEGAVGLIGLEVAEIAEAASAAATASTATSSKASAPSEATSSTAKTTAASATGPSAARSTALSPASTLALASLATRAATGKRLIELRVLAKLVHVHPGEGICGACLPGHGNRVSREVRVVRQ